MHKWIICAVTWIVFSLFSACALPDLVSWEPVERLEEPPKSQETVPDINRKEEKQRPTALTKVKEIQETGYAFTYLSEEEKIWYPEILCGLQNMEDEVALSQEPIKAGLQGEDIDKVFQAVVFDHPELFYVNGYEYTGYQLGDKLVSLEFTGKYTCTPEEAAVRGAEIEVAATAVLDRLKGLTSQYDICKAVYETLILETEYCLESAENQNIYSVFVNHSSVCQGYAKAFQYLCLRMGIDATLIVGKDYTGEGHAWNLVLLDGNYYLSDITWGEANYKQDYPADTVPEINYDFFLVTSEEMQHTHLDEMWYPLPKCVSRECNYFVQEGLYMEQYDETFLRQLFAGANAEEKQQVSIKFDTKELYLQVKDELVEQGRIFTLWDSGDKQLYYSSNENVNTMTFWMTNE